MARSSLVALLIMSVIQPKAPKTNETIPMIFVMEEIALTFKTASANRRIIEAKSR